MLMEEYKKVVVYKLNLHDRNAKSEDSVKNERGLGEAKKCP